jgi:alkylation response protein AidB-like acyl-CoA dehydrogenase
MGIRAAGTGRLTFEDVKLQAGALLGDAHPSVFAEAVQLARLGWCAVALGTGQAVLEYVIPYVNERRAFGEPISHRQAVAFAVANMAIELEGMRLATYRAASRVDQGLPFAREAALAHRLCAERGVAIGSDGVQLLGGHGYVKEHPVERWYRDLRAAGVMEGALLA